MRAHARARNPPILRVQIASFPMLGPSQFQATSLKQHYILAEVFAHLDIVEELVLLG